MAHPTPGRRGPVAPPFEHFEDLCEPLFILPTQLSAPSPPAAGPEFDLMYAVLVGALEDLGALLRESRRWERHEFRWPRFVNPVVQAERAWRYVPPPLEWMYDDSPEDPAYIYTYRNVCECFDLDATALREYVRTLVEQADLRGLGRLASFARAHVHQLRGGRPLTGRERLAS